MSFILKSGMTIYHTGLTPDVCGFYTFTYHEVHFLPSLLATCHFLVMMLLRPWVLYVMFSFFSHFPHYCSQFQGVNLCPLQVLVRNSDPSHIKGHVRQGEGTQLSPTHPAHHFHPAMHEFEGGGLQLFSLELEGSSQAGPWVFKKSQWMFSRSFFVKW